MLPCSIHRSSFIIQHFKNFDCIQQVDTDQEYKVEINGLEFLLKSQVYEKYKKCKHKHCIQMIFFDLYVFLRS